MDLSKYVSFQLFLPIGGKVAINLGDKESTCLHMNFFAQKQIYSSGTKTQNLYTRNLENHGS